jgi:hypothetical protein
MNNERFAMKDWQPLSIEDKLIRVEEEINAIDQRREPFIIRKKEIDLELSTLVNGIRMGRLSPIEYAEVCRRQNELKSEKHSIEVSISVLKNEIRLKNTEREKIRLLGKKEPNDKRKEYLIELRDKYTAFAADSTRVSSMRAMAAKFVEEVQIILKHSA